MKDYAQKGFDTKLQRGCALDIGTRCLVLATTSFSREMILQPYYFQFRFVQALSNLIRAKPVEVSLGGSIRVILEMTTTRAPGNGTHITFTSKSIQAFEH